MKWEDRGRSANLEDRRGAGRPATAGGGVGRAGLPLGIGGLLLIVAISAVTGVDLLSLLGMGTTPAPTTTNAPVSQQELATEEGKVRFVSFVLDDIQTTWKAVFERSGLQYPDAQMVLFRQGVQSACGVAPSSAGPFYCPADRKMYIDLSFYDVLRDRYGAPGDFAEAYVIAHEIGHHVQNLLGTLGDVQSGQRAQPANANRLSVALELQADCYAGVWAASAGSRGLLERGDLEEGLGAAAAVGDDRLSGASGRIVNQESFTHGTSAQRMQWFRTGYDTGDPQRCDTFSAL